MPDVRNVPPATLREIVVMAWLVALSFSGYLQFYRDFLLKQWRDMSPVGYGVLLIGIGVFGWLLMKSGTKAT